MSDARFRRSAGGVTSLDLHVVWCPEYRRKVLGGRVTTRLDEVLKEIAAAETVRRYIEHQWDDAA